MQCNASLGVGIPDGAVFDTSADHYLEVDGCSSASGFSGLNVSHRVEPTDYGQAAGWTFLPPEGTTFAAVSAVASGFRGPVPEDDFSPELIAGGHIFGAPTSQAEAFYSWEPSKGGNGQAFTARLFCPRPNGEGGCRRETPLAYLNVRELTFAITDMETAAPPQITNAGSSLASSQSVRGTVSAGVAGSDGGAGVAFFRAVVNDGQAGQLNAQCSSSGGIATRLQPCPLQTSGQIALDTTKPPWRQGLNRTEFCVYEFAQAGQKNDCSPGPDVRVDNACPVEANQGVVGFEQLGFAGGKATDGRTTFGSNVKLTGRAVDSQGLPVPNAEVCIGERVNLDPYTEERIIGTPQTGPDGRFSLPLPNGPNRVFRVAQWQTSGPLAEQFAELAVKAKPQLALRPKGRIEEGKRIHFRAKLNEPVVPGQGARMEARTRAGWVGIPECSGPVDDEGRLACDYRLPKQDGAADYRVRFRVVVPRAEGYPYMYGTSKVISKEVRG